MRMTCREAAARIGADLDRDGPLASRLRLRLHLAICRDCRGHRGQVRATRRLVRAAVERPSDIDERLAPALAARRQGRGAAS